MIRTLIFFLQWSCIKINCQIQILHINYFLKCIRVNDLSYNNDIISLIKYLMNILMDKKNQLFLCRKMYVRSCIWFNVISRANVFSYKYIQFIVGFDIPLIFRRFHIYSLSVGLQLNTRYLKNPFENHLIPCCNVPVCERKILNLMFQKPPPWKTPNQNQNTVNLLYLQRNYNCIVNFESEIEILQKYSESDKIFFSVAHASANVSGG